MQSARAALDAVGVPAVLKPADSGGQRGIFYVDSEDELDGHVHAALAESPTDEAIVESFHDGLELNGIVIARGGEAFPLTLSDRLRPPGIGFGVGWIHVYPASIYADVLAEAERVAVHAVHALGLRDGIAFPQLIVSDDGSVRVVEVAARIPGGQMADLVRHAVGVDLVEVALRQALGEEATDELVLPKLQAAARDPLPDRAAGAAADGEGACRSGRSSPSWPARASSRRTPTCRSARRSGRCGWTATGAAT